MPYDRTLILLLYSPNDSPLNREILKMEAQALALKTTIGRFVKDTTHWCELYDETELGDQLARLTPNSQLSIYGHCETIAIGGKVPKELAEYLYGKGLRQAKNINLIACETSVNLGMFQHGSFAQEFLVEIRKVGDPHPQIFSVTGREGDVTIRAGEAYPMNTWGTKQVTNNAGELPKGANKRVFLPQ